MAARKATRPAKRAVPPPAPPAAAPPSSRPTERSTRERILAAAQEEFAAHGLRGARVQEIVARAGVNQRMLYHHFGDKDGLYRAVLERYLTNVAAGFEGLLDAPGDDPVERLRAMLRQYVDGMLANPNMVRVFLHEAVAGWPSHAVLQDLRRAIDERLMARSFGFFAEAERAGAFREGIDPRMAALVAGGACLMLSMAQPRVEQLFAVDFRDPAALATVRDALIDTLLRGVVAPRRARRR
jgi:TetR/AcrR family transcriptional regulator